MTWIFYAKCDDDELTSTYVAWYKISVQLAIIVIMEILTPTTGFPHPLGLFFQPEEDAGRVVLGKKEKRVSSGCDEKCHVAKK
jgi:hypothetical protein